MAKIDPNDIKQELARLRTTFALRRLSADVQNAVLSDGTIAARMGIDLSHPLRLPGNITIERSVLFAAFQHAADGKPIPDIYDSKGSKRTMQVAIEADNAIFLTASIELRFLKPLFLLRILSVVKSLPLLFCKIALSQPNRARGSRALSERPITLTTISSQHAIFSQLRRNPLRTPCAKPPEKANSQCPISFRRIRLIGKTSRRDMLIRKACKTSLATN